MISLSLANSGSYDECVIVATLSSPRIGVSPQKIVYQQAFKDKSKLKAIVACDILIGMLRILSTCGKVGRPLDLLLLMFS